MQNPSVIRTKPTMAVSTPARELSWSFMLLVIICACVVAAGFFFAARQHFSSMEYGLKNSKLREQLQNLETEKRRLLLAREVASSPLAIRKAAPVSEVIDTARFLRPVEGEKMRGCEVKHMDVIANAGAVAGRVVSTVE